MGKGHLGLGKIALVFFIALIFYAGSQAICIYMDLEQNVSGYFHRAKDAATAETMIEFIDLGIDGLEKYGIAEGNWSWIATDNPRTDMGISVTQLENIKGRLRALTIQENMNISSVAYAWSLDEIREDLDKIPIDDYDLYTKKYKSYLYTTWIVLTFVGLFVLGFFIPAMTWDIYLVKGSWICKIRGHDWRGRERYNRTKDEYEVHSWLCHRCSKEQEGKTKP